MRIAVTGASGIVGSFVTPALVEAGHDVLAIDSRTPHGSPACEFALVDLTSYDRTRDAVRGVDSIVHLAGINAPIVAPEWQVHNNNVVASYNVMSAAAELGVPRVVQSSSVNAIGLAWSRAPEFDYFPIDLAHQTRNEDGYSLSKLAQEMQADSLTRRYERLSVVSLRLHAVLEDAGQAQRYIDVLGEPWAVNGLFGYCTFKSVADVIERACVAPTERHEVLWVIEPETFASSDSLDLAQRFYPSVNVKGPLLGRAAFFDASRTREVLDWTPSTVAEPPTRLVDI
jgi:nucleoside-diphosphate-sugar epimerase